MPRTTRPNDLAPGSSIDDLDDVMTPAMTDEEAERARTIRDAPASLQAALPRNRGGRPPIENPKVHVSLRIDPDVLAAYKATGAGWQGRVNDTLRDGAGRLGNASSAQKPGAGRTPVASARSRTSGRAPSNASTDKKGS